MDIEELKLIDYYFEINVFCLSYILGLKDRVLKLFEKFIVVIVLGVNFFLIFCFFTFVLLIVIVGIFYLLSGNLEW